MSSVVAPALEASQRRHSGAVSRAVLSLRARLAILVVVAGATVICVEAYLQVRVLERSVERDLTEIGRSTAQAVADAIEIRPDPNDTSDLTATLHEFAEAIPAIRAISLVTADGGVASAVASTSSNERTEALSLAALAIIQNRTVAAPALGSLRTVATPVVRASRSREAIVVTVSIASFEEARKRGRLLTLIFAPAMIVSLTLLVDLLGRRLIHRPIAVIRETMRRAGEGQLDARAALIRHDEIGEVASGLNDMLARMQNFNVELQERVREATSELRLRNRELVDSYQRVFALREALGRAEQLAAVGQTAATVAHQIGTPLNLISGYVQMMIEEVGGGSRMGRRLELLEDQIRRVTLIVRTMLEHVRRPPRPRTPSSVRDLVERVCEVSRPALAAAGVTLEVHAADAVPPIVADAEELELALLNLVSNSWDAMPEGGTLNVAVSAPPGIVRIEVADSGTGIPDELLPRIFEPWVTTKAVGRGTGLGLSIARGVVMGHGGSISARNRSGSGAVLTIDLPLAPEPEHA